MKTIQSFKEFYNKSKDRSSNKNEGIAACKEWLSFFTSESYPRWLSAVTVANLAMAMRNYQINKRDNSSEINMLMDLIDYFVMNFKPQEISNTLLSLNQVGLSWSNIEAKNPGLANKLLESVSSNVSSFNAQLI